MSTSPITVLFFARLREELGTREITLPGESTTAAALLEKLIADHPHWRPTLERAPVLCAVNQLMTSLDHPVHPGDEVGFFPMVTGG